MFSNIITVIVFSVLLLIPMGLPYSEAQTDNTYKFDAGFYDKIAQMQLDLRIPDSGEIPNSHYYTVIIITGDKNDLINDLQNDYNARNIFNPENLDNVITADVPILQIPRLAEIHNVIKIGDGELEVESLEAYDPRDNSHVSIREAKEYHGVTSQITQTGNGVTIGVIDQFNDERHNDLPDSDIIDRKNCYGVSCTSTFDSSHFDGDTHFNHAASIITGTGASNSDMTGFAPDSKIRLTIIDSPESIVKALDYLVETDVDLIMMIAGYPSNRCVFTYIDNDIINYESIALIIDSVVRNEIPVITANGNYAIDPDVPSNTIASSACSYNSIGVGYTYINGQINENSSRGPAIHRAINSLDQVVDYGAINPDISAIGTSIAGATTGIDYRVNSGTSFSTPVVTAVTALLLDKDTSLSSNELRTALLLGAEFGQSGEATARLYENTAGTGLRDYIHAYGFGKLNAADSLDLVNDNRFPNIISDHISESSLTKTYRIMAESGDLVKVLMSWNVETVGGPGNISLAEGLVPFDSLQDYDLKITTPDGTEIISDSIAQNKEFVFFDADQSGIYEITVSLFQQRVSTVGYALGSSHPIDAAPYDTDFTSQECQENPNCHRDDIPISADGILTNDYFEFLDDESIFFIAGTQFTPVPLNIVVESTDTAFPYSAFVGDRSIPFTTDEYFNFMIFNTGTGTTPHYYASDPAVLVEIPECITGSPGGELLADGLVACHVSNTSQGGTIDIRTNKSGNYVLVSDDTPTPQPNPPTISAITIPSTSSSTATHVLAVSNVPTGYSFASATPAANLSADGVTASGADVNGIVTITFGLPTVDTPTPISGTLNVLYSNGANNLPVVPVPVTITVVPSPPNPGTPPAPDPPTISAITIPSTSSSTATHVLAVSNVPTGYSFASATPAANLSADGVTASGADVNGIVTITFGLPTVDTPTPISGTLNVLYSNGANNLPVVPVPVTITVVPSTSTVVQPPFPISADGILTNGYFQIGSDDNADIFFRGGTQFTPAPSNIVLESTDTDFIYSLLVGGSVEFTTDDFFELAIYGTGTNSVPQYYVSDPTDLVDIPLCTADSNSLDMCYDLSQPNGGTIRISTTQSGNYVIVDEGDTQQPPPTPLPNPPTISAITIPSTSSSTATHVLAVSNVPTGYSFASATPAANLSADGVTASGADVNGIVTITFGLPTVDTPTPISGTLNVLYSNGANNLPVVPVPVTITVVPSPPNPGTPPAPDPPTISAITIPSTSSSTATHVLAVSNVPTGYSFASATPAANLSADGVTASGADVNGIVTITFGLPTVDTPTPISGTLNVLYSNGANNLPVVPVPVTITVVPSTSTVVQLPLELSADGILTSTYSQYLTHSSVYFHVGTQFTPAPSNTVVELTDTDFAYSAFVGDRSAAFTTNDFFNFRIFNSGTNTTPYYYATDPTNLVEIPECTEDSFDGDRLADGLVACHVFNTAQGGTIEIRTIQSGNYVLVS